MGSSPTLGVGFAAYLDFYLPRVGLLPAVYSRFKTALLEAQGADIHTLGSQPGSCPRSCLLFVADGSLFGTARLPFLEGEGNKQVRTKQEATHFKRFKAFPPQGTLLLLFLSRFSRVRLCATT